MEQKKEKRTNGAKSEAKAENLSKTYHFIAGMPRSGSTLLANILAQIRGFTLPGRAGDGCDVRGKK